MTEARKLARQLAYPRPGGPRLRQGIVTAVASDRTVTVQLGGSSATLTGIPCLTSAVPRVNSAVMLLTAGRDLFVVGSIADNAALGYTPLEQYGTATLSFSASASGNVAVSFPWSFPSTPKVLLTSTRTGGGKVVAVSDDSASASGFTAYGRVVDGTSVTDSTTVKWLALHPGS